MHNSTEETNIFCPLKGNSHALKHWYNKCS